MRLFALVALAFVLAALGAPSENTTDTAQTAKPQTSKPLTVGSPEWLYSENACWRGEEPPLADVPGHVIARRNGDWAYGGTRLTGMALDQLFGDTDHGLAVYAFCR